MRLNVIERALSSIEGMGGKEISFNQLWILKRFMVHNDVLFQDLHIMDKNVIILNYSINKNDYSLVIERDLTKLMLQDFMINIAESHKVEMVYDFCNGINE